MFKQFIQQSLSKVVSTTLCLTMAFGVKPACSAEKIRVIYGPFDFAVKVESLERYAETGEINPDLAFYLNRLDEDTKEEFRKLLQRRFSISQVKASRILRTSLGKDIIQQLGYIFRISLNTNGLYALRGAIVESAGDPDGFTVVDVLSNFPIESIYVNAESLLQFQKELTVFSEYRQSVVKAIASIAAQEAIAKPLPDLAQLQDLGEKGPFEYTETTITVTKDAVRQTRQGLAGIYSFPAYLYIPENSPTPAPVIIISHGFGARRENFTQLASHLASYGYVVAIPEHVGSDLAYREELLQGKLSTAISPMEYLDRPGDISYLLDELEQLAAASPIWKDRVNLEQVGVIGESLGGTTVLSLAGAEINPVRLQEECGADNLNIDAGLILQCQATTLPPTKFNLKDQRIKAVISAHPLTSAIFGPEGMAAIDIPSMIVGGSNDFVTPVVREQVHPFIWLNSPDKHFVMFKPGTHFTSSEPPEDNPVDYIPGPLIGENRGVAFKYFRGLSVAFMNVYLKGESSYQSYLTAAYGQAMSQPDLNIYHIQALTPEELTMAYGKTPPEAIIPPPLTPQPILREESIIAEIKSTGVIKMAMRRDAIPFGYLNQDGDWTGYCAQFANTFATYVQEQLDLDLAPKIIKLESNLENRFDLVEAETVHFECGPNTIRNDLNTVIFSQPFFITGTHFVVLKENIDSVDPNRGLNQLKVGVLANTTNELIINDNYPEADLVKFQGSNARIDAIQALTESKIDTVLDDYILILAQIVDQEMPLEAYDITPKIPVTCSYYGLILPNNDPEWNKLVNAFLNTNQARNIQIKTFPKEIHEKQIADLNYCLNLKEDF